MRIATASVLGFAALIAGPRPASADPPAAAPPELPPARRVPPPDSGFTYADPQPRPTFTWALLQLVPSPQVGFGTIRRFVDETSSERVVATAWGLRWQLTPALWSFGVHRRTSGWRFFVVDPVARMSGSIALEQNLEYFGGHVDRLLVRPGVKVTLPLLHRGEYLAFSMGTSVYTYDGTFRVAYDVGAYAFFGLLGLQATVAPTHDALMTIATLRIRYF